MNNVSKKLADALQACLPHMTIYAEDADIRKSACDAYKAAREALATYDAFTLGVAEAHSDVTTHVGPDLIEVYDEGRASVRAIDR